MSELLQEAIKLEEDGRRHYLDIARRTKNALARPTLEAVASEEGKHRSHIEAHYKAQQERTGWGRRPVGLAPKRRCPAGAAAKRPA